MSHCTMGAPECPACYSFHLLPIAICDTSQGVHFRTMMALINGIQADEQAFQRSSADSMVITWSFW